MSIYPQLALISVASGLMCAGEEVRNSENVVPQSMVIAFFISGAMAFGASIAILFSVETCTGS